MFGLFKKKRTVVIPRKKGPFHLVWHKTHQPSPGVMNYAYETLALFPVTPAGPTVNVRQPHRFNPLQPLQPVVTNAVPVQGIPTTAGQIFGQPLFDPDTGHYTRGAQGYGNVPYARSDLVEYGLTP